MRNLIEQQIPFLEYVKISRFVIFLSIASIIKNGIGKFNQFFANSSFVFKKRKNQRKNRLQLGGRNAPTNLVFMKRISFISRDKITRSSEFFFKISNWGSFCVVALYKSLIEKITSGFSFIATQTECALTIDESCQISNIVFIIRSFFCERVYFFDFFTGNVVFGFSELLHLKNKRISFKTRGLFYKLYIELSTFFLFMKKRKKIGGQKECIFPSNVPPINWIVSFKFNVLFSKLNVSFKSFPKVAKSIFISRRNDNSTAILDWMNVFANVKASISVNISSEIS